MKLRAGVIWMNELPDDDEVEGDGLVEIVVKDMLAEARLDNHVLF